MLPRALIPELKNEAFGQVTRKFRDFNVTL